MSIVKCFEKHPNMLDSKENLTLAFEDYGDTFNNFLFYSINYVSENNHIDTLLKAGIDRLKLFRRISIKNPLLAKYLLDTSPEIDISQVCASTEPYDIIFIRDHYDIFFGSHDKIPDIIVKNAYDQPCLMSMIIEKGVSLSRIIELVSYKKQTSLQILLLHFDDFILESRNCSPDSVAIFFDILIGCNKITLQQVCTIINLKPNFNIEQQQNIIFELCKFDNIEVLNLFCEAYQCPIRKLSGIISQAIEESAKTIFASLLEENSDVTNDDISLAIENDDQYYIQKMITEGVDVKRISKNFIDYIFVDRDIKLAKLLISEGIDFNELLTKN